MQVIIRYSKDAEMVAEDIAREMPNWVPLSLECTDKNPALVPAGPDDHCPQTMMILGAALSGGDAISLAKGMTKNGKSRTAGNYYETK